VGFRTGWNFLGDSFVDKHALHGTVATLLLMLGEEPGRALSENQQFELLYALGTVLGCPLNPPATTAAALDAFGIPHRETLEEFAIDPEWMRDHDLIVTDANVSDWERMQ
jgi:hypothetical protein